jgi:hypothetical protein
MYFRLDWQRTRAVSLVLPAPLALPPPAPGI